MSLIQEALKRQQMEQEGKLPPPPGGDANASPLLKSTVVDGETFILPGAALSMEEPEPPAKLTLKRNGKAAPPPVATPPAPPAVAEPEPEPEPERKRISPMPAGDDVSDRKQQRVLPSLAAVIILLLLLAGAFVWAVSYGLERAGIRMPWSGAKPMVAEQPAAEPPAAASAADTAAVKATQTPPATPVEEKPGADTAVPAKKTTIGSVVRQTVKDATSATKHADVVIADAAGEDTADAKPPAKAAPVMVPPPVNVTAAEPPATAVAVPPPVAAAPATATAAVPPPPAIKWPDITISGVVGKEQAGAVFVNGKVIGVNETVEGIRIVAIKPQGALLEYQGETRLAKVGQPINRANR